MLGYSRCDGCHKIRKIYKADRCYGCYIAGIKMEAQSYSKFQHHNTDRLYSSRQSDDMDLIVPIAAGAMLFSDNQHVSESTEQEDRAYQGGASGGGGAERSFSTEDTGSYDSGSSDSGSCGGSDL
jgi:hypothetical protein